MAIFSELFPARRHDHGDHGDHHGHRHGSDSRHDDTRRGRRRHSHDEDHGHRY